MNTLCVIYLLVNLTLVATKGTNDKMIAKSIETDDNKSACMLFRINLHFYFIGRGR